VDVIADADSAKYFIYEIGQTAYPATNRIRFTKAVRLGVIPTSARATSIEQQRSVLNALAAQRVLSLFMVADLGAGEMWLSGVQGSGDNVAEATRSADRGWEVLVDQRAALGLAPLEPVTLLQADAVIAAQAAWRHVAVLRGRTGTASVGLSAVNRGVHGPFIVSVVVVPLDPADVAAAWHRLQIEIDQTSSAVKDPRFLSTGMYVPLGIGVAPIGSATPDEQERQRDLGIMRDVLVAQASRYAEGTEGPSFVYEGFVLAPSATTISAVARDLLSASHAPDAVHFPQPLTVTTSFEPVEAARLITHGWAFSSDRRPSEVAYTIEPFEYSTFVTAQELAVLIRPS
jgi:hypothetical protein